MENYQNWNRIVLYVSDIYEMTKRFKAGEQEILGNHIRRTAIRLTAYLNEMQNGTEPVNSLRKYSILSVASVLEVYLQQAKEFSLIKDPSILQKKILEVKKVIEDFCGEEQIK